MKKKILKFIAVVSGLISAWAVVSLGLTYLKEARKRLKCAGEFAVGSVSGAVSTDGKRTLKIGRKRRGVIGTAIAFLKFVMRKVFRIFLKRVLHIPFIKV